MAGEPQGVKDIQELVEVFLRLERQKMTRVKEANHLVNQIRVSPGVLIDRRMNTQFRFLDLRPTNLLPPPLASPHR